MVIDHIQNQMGQSGTGGRKCLVKSLVDRTCRVSRAASLALIALIKMTLSGLLRLRIRRESRRTISVFTVKPMWVKRALIPVQA